MIKRRLLSICERNPYEWRLDDGLKITEKSFLYLEFKINGIVYTEYTKEFINACSKARTWMLLNDRIST